MKNRIMRAIAESVPERRGAALNAAMASKVFSFSDLLTDLEPFIVNLVNESSMRHRIERTLELEPSFSVNDDAGPNEWNEKDPAKRFAVVDAEAEVVCHCGDEGRAYLVRDLLNAASE